MLTPEQRRRAEKIFAEALDMAAEGREAFIQAECGFDSLIIDEVHLLLKHYDAAPPEFLDRPDLKTVTGLSVESIGPYELKESIGEGGMGIVYRAQQTVPVSRGVALKILKLGMDSKEILARFEAERQTLARLEHPNIARVYDAGTAANGRPYFVMEYVPGVSITHYCDAHKLTPRARVELFARVCDGVQYAHQQGIIHRDLKPMNILVADVDGVPQPKVIDFGVAKAVQAGLTGSTFYTQQGQLIGTPEYMSPEQAEAAPVDIRSDVYSLGAVLYELLVGALPIDTTTIRKAGYRAMMNVIREQEPERPSTHADNSAGPDSLVSESRGLKHRELVRVLRGDLDWITLKALEKAPDRRYGTVAELATDLRRHLVDLPVVARPASLRYTAGKFVRRHRMGVGISLSLVAALVVLVINTTLQSKRVAEERDRANQEATVSGQVKDFLVEIFDSADPEEARGQEVSARELLDRGAERIDEIEDDATRAELSSTLGAVYQNLGLYDQSDSLYVSAKDIWLALEGAEHPKTLQSLANVAASYSALGRYVEAESLYTMVVQGWDQLELPQDQRAVDAAARLAQVYRRQGHYARAESLYLRTVEPLQELHGPDNLEVLQLRAGLAGCYRYQERFDEAAPLYEDVISRLRRLDGEDSPQVLRFLSGLGFVYSRMGKYEEAEAVLIESRDGNARIFGDQHPNYLASLEALGALYYERDDFAEAEVAFSEVLSVRRATLGDEHPATAISMHNLAGSRVDQGKYAQAAPLAHEVLELRVRKRGDEHPYTQQTRWLVAVIAVQQGLKEEALEHLQIAVDHGIASSYLLMPEALAPFEPLAEHPQFQAILDTMKQRLESK